MLASGWFKPQNHSHKTLHRGKRTSLWSWREGHIRSARRPPRGAGGGEGGQAVRGAAAQPPGAKASLLHPQQRRPRVVACDSGVTSIEKPPIVLVHTGF